MTILRHYVMTAAEGQDSALRDVLKELAAKVRPFDGCEGVDLYQDPDNPQRFTFIEKWESVDSHRAAGKALGREAFAPVMAVLAGPPESAYLEPVAD